MPDGGVVGFMLLRLDEDFGLRMRISQALARDVRVDK